jgi:hypothetical protein
MAINDSVRAFFKSAKPAARLDEIEAAIKAAEGERADHLAHRPGEVVAKMTGNGNAAARVDAIDQAIAIVDARLRDLREAAGEIRRRAAADAAAARKAEAEARPRRIAELRRERLELMQTVTVAMANAAAALRATQANADALVAELGPETTGRFLSFRAFQERAQSAFSRAFAIDPNKPLTDGNSLLGLASREVGARAHWTAAQHETSGMDDLAPFFLDEGEAEAARDRLAARRRRAIVVPLAGGVWTLIPAERVFGDQAAADQAARADAARQRPTAVIRHQSGWALVPLRFTGEAA